MEATDLMIGDWVSHDNKPKKVMVIWGNAVSLYDQSKELGSIYSDKFSEEDVSPIPLTPEILEKNGFVLKSDGWLWCAIKSIEDKNYIFIQYRKGCQEVRLCEINFTNNVIMRSQFIQYVHELQHALKLCKIKKEIEL